MNVQTVRVLDVLVIAPFLIFVATMKQLPTWIRVVLLIIGVSTLVYNGVNYLNKKE